MTYRYRPGWSRHHSDASRFEVSSGHRNPPPLLPPGNLFSVVADATLPCGLIIPRDMLEQLAGFEPVPLSGPALGQPAHLPPAAVVDGGSAVYLWTDEAWDTAGGGAVSSAARRREALLQSDGAGDTVGGRAVPSAAQRREALTRLPADASTAAPPRTIADVSRWDTGGEDRWDTGGEGRWNTGGERRARRGWSTSVEGRAGRGGAVVAPGGWSNTLPVLARAPQPAVGDTRVRWEEVRTPPEGVSVLAKQRAAVIPEGEGAGAAGGVSSPLFGTAPTLLPWGDGSGHFVFRLVRGEVSAEAMVENLRGEERRRRWLFRGLCWAGMAVGFRLVLGTIDAVAAAIPFGIGARTHAHSEGEKGMFRDRPGLVYSWDRPRAVLPSLFRASLARVPPGCCAAPAMASWLWVGGYVVGGGKALFAATEAAVIGWIARSIEDLCPGMGKGGGFGSWAARGAGS